MKSGLKFILGLLLTGIYSFVFIVVLNLSMNHEEYRASKHGFKSEWTKVPYYSLIENLELEQALNGNSEHYFTLELGEISGGNVLIIANNSFKGLFDAAFKQYQQLSLNRLIKYRKSDVIFPFHYFW